MSGKQTWVAIAALLAVSGIGYAALSNGSKPAASDPVVPSGVADATDMADESATSAPETASTDPLPATLSPPPPGLDLSRPEDCLIEPSRLVQVNSGVEGVIEAILVERGDDVHKGQVVARLKADVDRASVAAAQARAANVHTTEAARARAAYLDSVRQRSEEVSRYLARDKVEEAQANARAAAEESRAAAQEQRVARLEYTRSQQILVEKTVRSPIDGVVTERAMSVGEYRGPNASHILTIAQLDPLFVEVFAPINQIGSVAIGDSFDIFPEQPIGGRYTATVKVIDRVFDAASGTFGMRLELPNPGNRLPAGLRCRIELDQQVKKPA